MKGIPSLHNMSPTAFADVDWRMPRRALVDALADTVLALDEAMRVFGS